MARKNMPRTRNHHDMFEMASLMQKAIRRGQYKLAGYAASELYSNYHKAMWNRLMVISAEDCFGILTKELVALREKDEIEREKCKTPSEIPCVSNAVILLSGAKKSRDACYFACNFVLTPVDREEIIISTAEMDVFRVLEGREKRTEKREYTQLSFFGIQEETEEKTDVPISKTGKSIFEIAAILQKSVATLDMENLGYALDELRFDYREFLWKAMIFISGKWYDGYFDDELKALKNADDMVNKNKKAGDKDEIFISKAAILLCHKASGRFESITAANPVSVKGLIDWSQFKIRDIQEYDLPGGVIPEYVYDVHTIKGKREGKTDWQMNLVEQAALMPLQRAFFDDASWSLRYDYKYANGMCTESEYQESLKYRIGRSANTVEKILQKQ